MNGSDIWKQRVNQMVNGSNIFFINDIMYEPCEPSGKCNVDQRSFKAYFSRWMASTAKLAPFVHDTIMGRLASSAVAAAQSCTGGSSGTQCGLKWTDGRFDGSIGVGEQMAALEVVQARLVESAPDLVTANTGGTSEGDPSAGDASTNNGAGDDGMGLTPATVGDKAGAGILTAILISGVIGGCAIMVM